MFDLQSYLEDRRGMVGRALDEAMPLETTRPAVLHRAMRYSVFAGGKRFRPILCLASAEAAGTGVEKALVPAISLEALHTYTLIHDDLPCMDDDVLRRNKPTCHVVFGEANALLAGDALLTLAFEWLGTVQAPPPYPPCQLVLELAQAAGSQGVIGGQVEDLAAEGCQPSADLVDYIHTHKTGDLIRAAVRMGVIATGGSEEVLNALSGYAANLGKAFQIADDILNATGGEKALGKPTGTDAQRKKATWVAVHGLDASRRMASDLADRALTCLSPLRGHTEPLRALARYTVERAC
jgi:geranylgeranyl diphosphate synthase, type II